MNSTIRELSKYEARAMHDHQLPIVWSKAQGSHVWDSNGRMYLDFTSGIFVTNCGHGVIKKAIADQVKKGLIYSYSFPTQERLELSRFLITNTPDFCERVFFLSAGTEATDCAVKLMRLYSKKKLIVSFAGAMHGKSMLAEQLRGGSNWAEVTSNVFRLNFPTENSSFEKDILGLPVDHVAGFMIESYRGWDARFLPTQYVKELMKWAKDRDIPVCFDEIQGGFGRTGTLFAYEHYDVVPDLLCLGKGLGGGVPISAVIGRKKLLDIPDDLTSTYSANPLCCAAALANLKYLFTHDLVKKACLLGWMLNYGLIGLRVKYGNIVKDVHGKGLLSAIIMKNTDLANRLCHCAAERGLLLVMTGRESVKIGPPLSITKEDLMIGLDIIQACLEEIDEESLTTKTL